MIIARQAKELYDDLSGLASSDEMERLFSFVIRDGSWESFRMQMEGKWFAYDDASPYKYTVAAFGPFGSREEADVYVPDYSIK